ncbi:MAG TPA: PEP-CTERM sorting domain-containing protein [Caldimonas sp.]|jgi:hypothetical protein|nr:PEP-CTERM sorting domain-containing protein [Caldimonas sp.]HEX2542787.1 PEP-CTERM sorting domain-containing protein [Caldimonas sp.]
MKPIALAVATSALCLAAETSAAASFTFALHGTGAYLEQPAHSGVPQATPGLAFEWLGTLTFATGSSADGTYLPFVGPHGLLSSFSLNTNLISFDLGRGLNNVQIPPVITLSGGEVTFILFRYEELPDVFVRIDGMSATYSSTLNAGFHSSAVASLTPVTPVPEPETYALLLVGLALCGVARRRSAD